MRPLAKMIHLLTNNRHKSFRVTSLSYDLSTPIDKIDWIELLSRRYTQRFCKKKEKYTSIDRKCVL